MSWIALDHRGEFKILDDKPSGDIPAVKIKDGSLDFAKRELLREITTVSFGSMGSIHMIDVMGSDIAIVEAARQSYGDGTTSYRGVSSLINYLMRHEHTSPFEMAELKFHVTCPMDVWRQWIRHRTASVNEYSTRYSIAMEGMHKSDGIWRLQAKNNKQGSTGELTNQKMIDRITDRELAFHEMAREIYHERLELGIAREQARKDLPLSTMTQAVWKIDLHNLLRFLLLRTDDAAQYEIRQFAYAIEECVKRLFPITYEAYRSFYKERVVLSLDEKCLIERAILKNGIVTIKDDIEEHIQWKWIKDNHDPKTMFFETQKKLKELGIDLKTGYEVNNE